MCQSSEELLKSGMTLFYHKFVHCCNITSPPQPFTKVCHTPMVLYDSVVVHGSEGGAEVRESKIVACSKSGPISSQRQHVWILK